MEQLEHFIWNITGLLFLLVGITFLFRFGEVERQQEKILLQDQAHKSATMYVPEQG